ncbi:hypothetical protein P7C70_g45, partial [Phenoliferia sp. Uapishka_3]
MSEHIDILIVGFGAIGTIYGYLLSQNPKVRVTGIARSQADSFNANGVNIESERHGSIKGWRPYRVVKDAADAADRPYAFIIACFKCLPDLLPSASVLAPFLDSSFAQENGGPTLVLIQNGLGIEHPVQVAYPKVPIISAVAWIGANLLPGPTVTHGMLEELIVGLYQGEGGVDENHANSLGDPAGYSLEGGEERRKIGLANTKQFADLLNSGGGKCTLVDDIQPKRYEKVLWNACWSALCSLSRQTVSEMVAPQSLPYTLPIVRRLGLEVIYIAREWGYAEDVLPLKAVDDMIKITIKNYQSKTDVSTPATPMLRGDCYGGMGFPLGPSGANPTKDFKPSMLLDIEAGRPSELEPIIGSLLDRARVKGVETPRLDLIYATLKVNQAIAIHRYAESPEHQEHIKNWFLRKPAVGGAGIDGRKQWDKAVKRAQEERAENVAVRMVILASASAKASANALNHLTRQMEGRRCVTELCF